MSEPAGSQQGSQAEAAGHAPAKFTQAWRYWARTLGVTVPIRLLHVGDSRKKIRSLTKSR